MSSASDERKTKIVSGVRLRARVGAGFILYGCVRKSRRTGRFMGARD